MDTGTSLLARFRPAHALTSALIVGAWLVASPAVAADEAAARRQVRAVAATGPITLDGALDEASWSAAPPVGDFVQAEPRAGQLASEPTEVRVLYTEDALYIGAFCRDSEAGRETVNDIRKDFATGEQDSFEVLLDTFADRRNGFVFVTNPQGGRSDTQIANEGRDVNASWDAVWQVATTRTTEGWTAEIWIPFKTLRFEAGKDHVWGVNFARRIRRKAEVAYWSPVPRAYSIYRASQDGDLVGLPDVNQGRNLRIKPYVAASTTRATAGTVFDGTRDVGLDVKYGVTPSLTLDLAVNPDFAQVEADEQQVNLTQFSLFYPEKREFFLENNGIFYFGDIPRNQRQSSRFRPPEEELLLFFSRRIGLTDAGAQIPIRAGGRLTGVAGGFGIGAMTIQTERTATTPANNYTMFRLRRDILRNSDVGAIVESRQAADGSGDFNRVYGVDANFRFRRFLSINSFLTKSSTPGAGDGQLAGKGSVGWEDNVTHLQYSLLTIGDDFRGDLAYVRRTGIRKHFVDAGLRPRPEWLRRWGFRELHPHTRLNYYTDQHNDKLSVNNHYAWSVFRTTGAMLEFAVNSKYERIVTPFKVRPGVVIPVNGYGWTEYQWQIESDHSRPVSASFQLVNGGFYEGSQNSQQISVLMKPFFRLTSELTLRRNDISLRLPRADFVTSVWGLRTAYAFSTNMFLDSLLQYNTDLKQFNANVRFNLIHRPLSDIFVVYNEQQITDRDGVPPGRAVIVKYTHMFSF